MLLQLEELFNQKVSYLKKMIYALVCQDGKSILFKMIKKSKKYHILMILSKFLYIYMQYLSIKGIAGLTAYFGLTEIGQIKKGETVLVSSAAGGVGVYVV